MVMSLEYLARSVVIESSIKKMVCTKYKHYIVIGEHVEQYAMVLLKKNPTISYQILDKERMIVILKPIHFKKRYEKLPEWPKGSFGD